MSARKKEKLEQVSHKVIEKRRRDRINNCLAELSQAVPAAFAKQSSGKLEKAEILEMTVEYLRAINALGQKLDDADWLNPVLYAELQRHYAVGYGDCIREVLRYVTEVEGLTATDGRCVRMMTYLQHRLGPQMQSDEQVRRSPLLNQPSNSNSNIVAPTAFSSSSSPSSSSSVASGRVASTLNSKDMLIAGTHQNGSSGIIPTQQQQQQQLHGSRWSSHCLACHGPSANRKSSSTNGTDRDYFGLQFVRQATNPSAACLTGPSPFYHHHHHHHQYLPSDIFHYNNTGDFSKWSKPTH